MAAAPIVDRHRFLRFDHPSYTPQQRVEYESRYMRLREKAIFMPSSCDFSVFHQIDDGGAAEEIETFMTMRYENGRNTFISSVWRRLFEIRGVFILELIQEFFSTFEFFNTPAALRTPGTIRFQLGGGGFRDL
jgi:hypothetical protein